MLSYRETGRAISGDSVVKTVFTRAFTVTSPSLFLAFLSVASLLKAASSPLRIFKSTPY